MKQTSFFNFIFLVQGVQYLIDNGVLDDNCEDIGKFFHYTNQLCWHKVRVYLRERYVLQDLYFFRCSRDIIIMSSFLIG